MSDDDPFGRQVDKKIDEVLRVKSGGQPDPPPTPPLERFARRQRGEGRKWQRLRMWSVLFALIAVIVVLAVVLGLQDDLSCADDEAPATRPTTEQSPAEQSPAAQPGESEPSEGSGSEESQGSSLYDQARTALGMSENTATSQSGSGTTPNLAYYFRWVDADGTVQSDIGEVELVDDERTTGGHAYVRGLQGEVTGEGAYQITTNPLGIEFALWIPPPVGGEAQLIILHTTDTGARSLTGRAERDDNGKRTKLEYGVEGKLP